MEDRLRLAARKQSCVRVWADDAIHNKMILALESLDRGIGQGPEDAIDNQMRARAKVRIQFSLNVGNIGVTRASAQQWVSHEQTSAEKN
jgi:hypothetical protein